MCKYGFCAGGILETPGLGSRQQDLGGTGSPGVLVLSRCWSTWPSWCLGVWEAGVTSGVTAAWGNVLKISAVLGVFEARPLDKTLQFSSLLLDESRPARDEGFAGGVAESFGHGKRCPAESPARSEFFTQK